MVDSLLWNSVDPAENHNDAAGDCQTNSQSTPKTEDQNSQKTLDDGRRRFYNLSQPARPMPIDECSFNLSAPEI
jgi:hypothetical protein